MAVLPPDEVRRRSALSVNLDDHPFAILIADVTAPGNDLVAHFCPHTDHLPHRLAAGVLSRSEAHGGHLPAPGAKVPHVVHSA
jgi:hypothetical protein